MKLYIAGPMSGYAELNFPAFHEAAATLRRFGYSVVNPAEINSDPSMGWAACMRRDIPALCECDGVALLRGWEASRGARLERHIAVALGMLVKPMEHFEVAAEVQAC